MKLEVKNLVKEFKSTLAVNDVSFKIEKNKTLGLLGPNGCGKTTSIGMMLGLITPTKGKIYINEVDLLPENRIKILSLINFASPYIELPKKLTVKQNLEVYGRLYGIKNLNDRINEISKDLDIKNFFDKKTGELSSGQKNRVSLAKSLIKPTSSFLRGEPSKALPEKFTPKQILANVGTRIKRDENGDYHILATSISLPKTETGQSEEIAYKKAKADAKAMIRRFAGAQIQSKTETTVEEIFNE